MSKNYTVEELTVVKMSIAFFWCMNLNKYTNRDSSKSISVSFHNTAGVEINIHNNKGCAGIIKL